MNFSTVNPYDNVEVKRFRLDSERTVEKAIATAHEEFGAFKQSQFSKRIKMVQGAGELLLKDLDSYAKLITLEMGKPLAQARGEIEKCAAFCETYPDYIREFVEDEIIETEASNSFISFEPLGIILGIMPWNFPFWQAFRYAVPAILAGNVTIMKHAPSVPQCAAAIESIFKQAAFPDGVFRNLYIDHEQVKEIIKDPRITGLSLTGSDRAGSEVGAQAGKQIKKIVMELGGNDPFIVLSDASLKEAAEAAVNSRMGNAGQSCIAAKRLIVTESIAKDFVRLIKEQMQTLHVGDPMDDKTDIGPLAREDLAEKVAEQVNASVKKGAKVVLGGGRPNRKGAFFNPTILTNVKKGMPAYDEEIFGPVASVIVVENAEEAVEIANDTQYGLGASIWTVDLDRGTRLARQIEAGNVFVNDLVRSHPRLPFGGIKRSGIGRELSYIGIREFTNQKTIWVK